MTIVDFVHARFNEAEPSADLESKRAIVKLYTDELDQMQGPIVGGHNEREIRLGALADVIQRLALPYAEHPDYNQDWRP